MSALRGRRRRAHRRRYPGHPLPTLLSYIGFSLFADPETGEQACTFHGAHPGTVGIRREGTIEHLNAVAAALDYDVEQVPSVIVNGIRVSSTAIRDALGRGDTKTASKLLGRPYRMSGKIVKGDRPIYWVCNPEDAAWALECGYQEVQ